MDTKSNRGLAVAVGVLAALLLADAWLSYRNTRDLNDRAGWVSHTLEVQEALAELRAAVTDAETNARAYIVTGDDSSLVPYRAAAVAVGGRIDRVAELTADNPAQQARLPRLRQRARDRVGQLARLLDLRRDRGFEAARKEMAAGGGRAAMDALLATVGEMEQEEKGLLRDRQGRTRGAYRTARLTGVLATLLGLAAAGVVVWLGRRLLLARTRAATRLHAERERLRVSLTSIGDAVISVDTRGRVDFLNPAAEALTGWGPEEARGRPLDAVFPIRNEQTRQPAESPVARVLREGVVVGLANHTVLVARDGTERPIEDSAAPIKAADGRTAGVILVFHDVTERRRAERALRQSEESFRTSFELAAVGKVQIDPATGRYLRVNRKFCEITGYSADELRPLTPRDITHPDEREEDGRRLGRMLRGEDAVYTNDKRYVRKDGSAVWVSVTAALIRDAEGRPARTIGVVQDLTERKRLEDRLREQARGLAEANRHKDQFLAMLAHELRNPLAPLRTGLHLLKSGGADGAAVERLREMMERQVLHLARIVDDLLDVSRISRGKVELRPERVDLARLVRVAAEDHHPAFQAAGLRAVVEVPEVPVWVEGNPTRLTQVLGNLLTNAAKFTPRGGTVSVRLSPDGERGQAVLGVRDTGEGIDPGLLPRLFEPFAQADRSLDRSKGGLGLGLSLVKGLVQLHGGEVEARSDGPGRGAEFVVRLPTQPEPAALAGVPQAPGPAGKKLRVLVVEDNKAAADMLRVLLELYGYDATVAYTGPAGVAAAKAWGPDVVLCDIGLPGLDGYGVVRELRKDPATAHARVIAVTGYGSDEDRRKSGEAGFDAHLVKPADPARLQELLAGSEAVN
jgi:PAS domain S-box-containing protein